MKSTPPLLGVSAEDHSTHLLHLEKHSMQLLFS